MKKITRVITFAMAFICLALSLTSCSNRLVQSSGGFTHKKTGVSYYTVTNMCYQPIEYETEAYTKWKQNDVKVEYFAIKGLEPTEWLYCPMMSEIICSTYDPLPGIEGFDPTTAYICVESNTAYTIHEIVDQAKIDAIVERYLDENAPSYSTVMETTNYTIKFTSPAYPEFYYNMVLVADEDGVYIHDRMANKYIDMGLLFEEYNLYEGMGYEE